MVSIKDIARACAVTPSTVSRALNRRAGVSDKVREQILNKARELGYRRHEAAASLVTAQSPHIGLVIPDIVNPYYALMAKGSRLMPQRTASRPFSAMPIATQTGSGAPLSVCARRGWQG